MRWGCVVPTLGWCDECTNSSSSRSSTSLWVHLPSEAHPSMRSCRPLGHVGKQLVVTRRGRQRLVASVVVRQACAASVVGGVRSLQINVMKICLQVGVGADVMEARRLRCPRWRGCTEARFEDNFLCFGRKGIPSTLCLGDKAEAIPLCPFESRVANKRRLVDLQNVVKVAVNIM
jgi:hypothetical protein